MRRFASLLLVVALAMWLSGCLPTTLDDATPDAVVIAVPANARVPAAADLLHDRLASLDTGHDLAPRAGAEFLEVRRGLVGGRVAAGAAGVARSLGAEIAVAIGATTFERELRSPERAPRERVVLRLEVVLVRASDGDVLARVRGPRLVTERFLSDDALPPLDRDPLVRDLVERGVARLAPLVAEELRLLAVSGSSGG